MPTLRIENTCNNLTLVFQQTGNEDQVEIDICEPNEKQAFTWSDAEGKKELQIECYQGKYHFEEESRSGNEKLKPILGNLAAENIKITVDELNQPKKEIRFFDRTKQLRPNHPGSERFTYLESKSQIKVYQSVITDGLTKIIRFDNTPPELSQIMINGKMQQTEQAPDPKTISNFNIYLQQINFSLISQSQELMTIYMQNISMEVQ